MDFYGQEELKFRKVIDTARKVAELYSFENLDTPIMEHTAVFEKNLGDASDVVMKEMYTFKDRSDNNITLRPEFTAGIIRAVLQNRELIERLPRRFFSEGSVFRYDRPQKGRKRQFHQINFELFGAEGYISDIESIQCAYDILSRLGIADKTRLELNSIGNESERSNYLSALTKYLESNKEKLSEDSYKKLIRSPLRILDSKDQGDIEIIMKGPLIDEYYLDKTRDELDRMASVLKESCPLCEFSINPVLVRGLDYYSSTVFEFITSELGAQATVVGGGRYNNLIEKMGGSKIAAIGFSGGVERLAMLIDNVEEVMPSIAIVPLSENEMEYCLDLANMIRRNDLSVKIYGHGSLKKEMSKVNRDNCLFSVVIGNEEVATGRYRLKKLSTGQEIITTLDDILNDIIRIS